MPRRSTKKDAITGQEIARSTFYRQRNLRERAMQQNSSGNFHEFGDDISISHDGQHWDETLVSDESPLLSDDDIIMEDSLSNFESSSVGSEQILEDNAKQSDNAQGSSSEIDEENSDCNGCSDNSDEIGHSDDILNFTLNERLGVELLEWKMMHNISNNAFTNLFTILNNNKIFPVVDKHEKPLTLYKLKSNIHAHASVDLIKYNCCINSCTVFTPEDDKCYNCHAPQYLPNGLPQSQYSVFPLLPRLQAQYQNAERSEELRYRHDYKKDNTNFNIGDVFDGTEYQRLVNMGYFQDERDVALVISSDGFQIFEQGTHDCWPIIAINLNLPPEERYKKKNIMTLGLIPGPKQPKNINSFLQPIIEELKILVDGKESYDAWKREYFTLHAFVLAVTGDMPAVSKLGQFVGSNGKYACRFCYIEGVRSQEKQQYYYPLKYPTNEIEQLRNPLNYNPLSLPRRTHEVNITDGIAAEAAQTDTEHKEQMRKTGIKGISAFASLVYFDTIKAFGIDVMHLYFSNIARNMFSHWFDGFDNTARNENYVLSKRTWDEIGQDMESLSKMIPTAFGKPPRNIVSEWRRFTAEEWKNWITIYSLPLLNNRMHLRFLKGWRYFVRAVQISCQHHLNKDDSDTVTQLLQKFIEHYEADYYQFQSDRLHFCRSTFHMLLHVGDCIKNLGPPRHYWQFTMERYCGIIGPMVKSTLHPYTNLANEVHLMESIHSIKCCFPGFKESQSSKRGGVTLKQYYGNAELSTHEMAYTLERADQRRLREFFANHLGENVENIKIADFTGVRYTKYRSEFGHLLYAKPPTHKTTAKSRCNYRVVANQLFDELEHRPSAPPRLVQVEMYGEVLYFFSFYYGQRAWWLACVKWLGRCQQQRENLKLPTIGHRSSQAVFIEVSALDRCIGLYKNAGIDYVLDSELVLGPL